MRMSGRQRLGSARDDAAACLHHLYNFVSMSLWFCVLILLLLGRKPGFCSEFVDMLQHAAQGLVHVSKQVFLQN